MEEVRYKFKNREEYIRALDSVLGSNFLRTRTHGKGSTKYIPGAIKEAIADDIFHYWNVVDENYFIVNNQVVCTVKILYMPNHPDAQEHYCTGSAARPMGEAKNSLEYNIPGAKVEAISNAFNTLGNVFGRNVSRKVGKDEFLPSDYSMRNHEN